MHEEPARFFDRHHILVAVEDLERRVTAYWRGQSRWRGASGMVASKRRRVGSSGTGVFTRVRRLPELARYDLQVIHEILDAATHCHIAHVVAGRPVATPTLHWRI